MGRKPAQGKGANFATERNPFQPSQMSFGLRADYTEVPNLGKALQVLIQSECAIILGRTRDGGAMVVTILDGENRHRTYCPTSEELIAAFQKIEDMYGEG